MITKAMSVYYSTNLKNAPKMKKKFFFYKMSVPFSQIRLH